MKIVQIGDEVVPVLQGLLEYFRRNIEFVDNNRHRPEVNDYAKCVYPGQTMPTYELSKLRAAVLEKLITSMKEVH